jgi:uroporphyrinogen decarboxylase
MDINDLKKRYGGKVCLLGNIDVNTLSIGTPEQVEDEVKKRIKEIAPGGGYIVSSGHPEIREVPDPHRVISLRSSFSGE